MSWFNVRTSPEAHPTLPRTRDPLLGELAVSAGSEIAGIAYKASIVDKRYYCGIFCDAGMTYFQ